jgi:excinuclease UvrABC nuclease subunit
MINPADLNLSSLPWVPLDATAGFPSQPGIYFAIDSLNQIQYIGRTGNIRGRWKRHHCYNDLKAIGEIKVAYLFIDAPELLPDVEAALIEWFNPPLNIQLRKVQQDRLIKQHKAKAEAYGQKKTERFQVLFTADGLAMLDALAEKLKLSRSEFLERSVRWIDSHYSSQLEHDLSDSSEASDND